MRHVRYLFLWKGGVLKKSSSQVNVHVLDGASMIIINVLRSMVNVVEL